MSNFTFKHPSDLYSVFHMTIRIIFYNVKCQSSTEHVLIAFTVPRLKFKLHSVGFKVLYILALYLSHFLPIIIPSLTVLQPLWSVFYSSNIPRSFFFFFRACTLEVQDCGVFFAIQFSAQISPASQGCLDHLEHPL